MARARRILIVEDDAKTAASIEMYLRHDGFRTELARSGPEALQAGMSRLRWKLLAAMVALVVVTVGGRALFTRRATHEQVRRLLIARSPVPLDEAVRPLEAELRATGGVAGVAAVIDRVAAALGGRVVLTTVAGEVIAVSAELRTAKVTVDGEDQVTATYPAAATPSG